MVVVELMAEWPALFTPKEQKPDAHQSRSTVLINDHCVGEYNDFDDSKKCCSCCWCADRRVRVADATYLVTSYNGGECRGEGHCRCKTCSSTDDEVTFATARGNNYGNDTKTLQSVRQVLLFGGVIEYEDVLAAYRSKVYTFLKKIVGITHF